MTWRACSGFFALLLLGGCNPKPGAVASPAGESRPLAAEPAPLPTTAEIHLVRTGCLGSCPVFELVLYADGRIEWEGAEFVGVRGPERANVSAGEVAQLWAALNATHDKTPMPGRSSTGCTRTERTNTGVRYEFAETDQPSTTVSVVGGPTTWARTAAHGCPARDEIAAIETMADQIIATAGAQRWIEDTP